MKVFSQGFQSIKSNGQETASRVDENQGKLSTTLIPHLVVGVF